MPITLTVTAGPHQGKEFGFAERDSFLVGRSKHAHFALPRDDPYFSRKHFLVEVNPPRCRLLDLKSRNGTWVNGQRVQATELSDGDEIKAGHTILRLSIAQPQTVPHVPPSALDPALWESSPKGQLVNAPPSPALAETPSNATLVQPATVPQDFGGMAIPGYRPIKLLGEGGMGVVYLAERDSDHVLVAVKMLKTAPGVGSKQIQRFQREATILGDLHHPNIVGFHDVGAVDNHPYIVMEYVMGIDAETAVTKDGPLPIRTAVDYTCQLLDALEYAHGRGFVHRDIKPANMLVEERGQKRVVRLADFGLARVYEASQLSGVTLQGELGGTLAFMAPEQVTHFRDVSTPADQYSAAASLYYLLTGQFIFEFTGDVHPLILISMEEPVPLRQRCEDVPAKLAEAVQWALAKEPKKRFADVAAFRRALVPFG